MARRLPTASIYIVVENDSLRGSVELSGVSGRLFYCGVVEEAVGASVSRMDGCHVIEPRSETVKLKLKMGSLGEGVFHAAPPLARLPTLVENPYTVFSTVIVIDSPPTVTATGLEYERRSVITYTMRTLLEGNQPPQLLVFRGRCSCDPQTLSLYTTPLPLSLAENGFIDWPIADTLLHATFCERNLNYSLRGWGLCLARAATLVSSSLLLRELGENPFGNTISMVLDSMWVRLWVLGRNWAHIAVASEHHPLELAESAIRSNIYSSTSILVFEKIAGRTRIVNHLDIPVRVWLRSSTRSMEESVRVRDVYIVDGEDWDSYSIECQWCWRPLT